jgi:1-phosphofructokinase family hexose kinase
MAIYTLTLNPGLDRTLTVSSLAEDAVLRATSSRLDWGGKGFNVSRALKALGEESIALGIVGGFTGQMLTQGLATLGIATDFVQIDAETRTNTVIEEAHSGRYIKVNEAGPIVDAAALEMLVARIETHRAPASYWALCGSLPPGVPANFYARLIASLQSRGALACLDSSGEALRLGLEAAPFLVKPNREEASEIPGISITDLPSARRAAASILERGVKLVALTLDADGLLLAVRDESIHVRPPQASVQTTVGVGDALLAGVTRALLHELPLVDVARWGVACGTAAAMTPGIGAGSYDEVYALVAQMREAAK